MAAGTDQRGLGLAGGQPALQGTEADVPYRCVSPWLVTIMIVSYDRRLFPQHEELLHSDFDIYKVVHKLSLPS